MNLEEEKFTTNRDSAFYERKIFNISTKAYALLYNRFTNAIESSAKYTNEDVTRDIFNGKLTRPILVVWSNKYHNKFIAVPQTTSVSEYNKKNSFMRVNGINYLKHEVLLLDKSITKNRDGIGKYSERISKDELNDFLSDWSLSKHHSKSWNNFKSLKDRLEKEANQNIINLLKSQIK